MQVVALGLLFASPATGECLPDPPGAGATVTCSGNNPAGFAVPEGIDSVTVEVEVGATVASIGDGIVVRENSSVINHGEFGVNGIQSTGIVGGSGAEGDLAQFENTATGVIVINSDQASGFRLGNYTRVDNAGQIDVLGNQAVGVRAGNFSEVFNTGTLNISGESANGIAGNVEVLIENTGDIAVSGVQATGSAVGIDSDLFNRGTITLSGAASTGLEVGARSTVLNAVEGVVIIEATATDSVALQGTNLAGQVRNDGTITSTAAFSTGIQLANDVGLGINSGTMNLSASDATGLRGGQDSIVANDTDATLDVHGSNAVGLAVEIGGQTSNRGTVTISGDDARGLVGGDGSLSSPTFFRNEAGASLNVSGSDAVGIDFGLFASGQSDGLIAVNGTDSFGVRAGADSVFGNGGQIEVSGARSIGVEIGPRSDTSLASFINLPGGSVTSDDPEAGPLVKMVPATPGTESRVENRVDALIGFDPASFALEEIGVAIEGSDGDDFVINAGLIRGQVKLGLGNDHYLVEPGGRIDTLGGAVVDGEAGADTVELTAGAGGLGEFDASRIVNFELIRVTSGQWQLEGQTTQDTDVEVDLAGTLSLSRPTTIKGNYSHIPNPLPLDGDPEPTLRLFLGFDTEGPPVLTVLGEASLSDGVLELVVAGGFQGEASFVLLQATEPLNGAFDRIVLPENPHFTFTDPIYSANQIDFSIDVSGYSQNQWAVSQVLTGLSGTGIDPALQALIDQAEALDFDSYLAAMDALSPEPYDAHAQARFELGERFVQLMLERPRVCLPGRKPCRERIFEPWLATYGQFGHRDGGADHVSVQDDGGGLVLGFDRRVNDELLVAATVGTAYDSITVEGVGPGNFKTLDLGLYAGYTRGSLRLEGVASYGHGWHELHRNISVGDFSGQTLGRYDMERLGLRARAEYALTRGPVVVSPLVSLDYTALLQSEVNEVGSGVADLNLPSRNDTARTLRVGFDATTALEKTGYWTDLLEHADGVWRPTLSLRWRQPLGETNPAIPAAFAAAPSDPFEVFGDDSGEGFEVGVGVAWTPLVADRLTFTLRYDGFLWQDVSSNSFTGRVRFSF